MKKVDFAGKKVLFTDGCTSQCLEYIKSMKKLGCDTTVFCTSRLDVCFASRYPDRKILADCSPDNAEQTEDCIVSHIKTGNYDLAIAFTDFSAEIFSRRKEELSAYCRIAVNDYSKFIFARDKNNIMKLCAENNLPCPETVFGVSCIDDILKSSKLSFPLVIKPAHGYGARGFHRVGSREELSALIDERNIDLSSCVIQESIPRDSLNVSCNIFIDSHGDIKSSFIYKSPRFYPIDGGSGVMNITCHRADVHEISARLAKLLELRGPVGVDFIIDSRDNVPKVLEVNLRPIACARAGFLAGIDQAQQVLEDAFSDSVTEMWEYRDDVRVRRSQIDILWFIKSPDRFRTEPSWFSLRHTHDQLFSWSDPLPWLAFSLHGLINYKKEMQTRS